METSGVDGVCGRIIDRVAAGVGQDRFERSFRGIAELTLAGRTLEIAVPTAFHASWLATNFGETVLSAARRETGDEDMSLSWRVDPARFDGGPGPAAASAGPQSGKPAERSGPHHTNHHAGGGASTGRWSRAARTTASGVETTDRYALEAFVVGSSNRTAFDSATQLASDVPCPFQILFIHGECGVGKTHLLQGLAGRFARLHPGAPVRAMTGEQFTNEYIAAVKSGTIESFRSSLRRLALLCIDDVHFLAGKSSTQQEFLHTFDALDLCGSRVALASDEHPKQIQHLHERLVSRCLSGMVARVDRPDAVTRAGIARRLAAARGMRLEQSGVEALVQACTGSVRDIEGALARLQLLLTRNPELACTRDQVGGGLIRCLLASEQNDRPRKPVRIAVICETVCRALGVEMSEVLGRGRHKRIVLARSLISYLAREMTSQSYPEIAQALNRNNHSTIVTAYQRVARQVKAGALFEGEIDDLPVPAAELCDRMKRLVISAMK
ncbi:MAG: DnaA/Hda family protein [Planctomycetota bacterium]|nr:DnaA/Hda family protein [Planctomycetota bacterium]